MKLGERGLIWYCPGVIEGSLIGFRNIPNVFKFLQSLNGPRGSSCANISGIECIFSHNIAHKCLHYVNSCEGLLLTVNL
jgi:hypothetical protein